MSQLFVQLLEYMTTASESRLFGSVVRALVLYRGGPIPVVRKSDFERTNNKYAAQPGH